MSTTTAIYQQFLLRKRSRDHEICMLEKNDVKELRAKHLRDWAAYFVHAWFQSNETQPTVSHVFFSHRYRNRKTREVLKVTQWIYPDEQKAHDGYDRVTKKMVEVPEQVEHLSQVTRETENVKESLGYRLIGECFEQRRRGVFGRVVYRFIIFQHSGTVWSVGLARRGEPPEWKDIVAMVRRQREKLEHMIVSEE